MRRDSPPAPPPLRLDKWLWHARFFKSRTLATRFCSEGRVRVNGVAGVKPHHAIRAGDVLTFALGPHVRVVKVVGLGVRRGPASEARALYHDLEPPEPRKERPGLRARGAGRPTKAERRAIEKLQRGGG